MKKYLFVANWKLNGSIEFISNYFKFFNTSSEIGLEKNIIVIAPPAIYLNEVYKNIHSMNIFLGAQNVDKNLTGAFTGETSILMLKDIGVKYVIVGHSERRLLHNENNDLIIKKFDLIKSLNLIPILCVGETEKEKKHGQTKIVIEEQLNCVLTALGTSAFRNTVIAYEPVWAIGTGLSADPKYVQCIHKFIRNYIEKYDPISAKNIFIQYGGSINSVNAEEFIKQPDINGLLIGSASLDYQEFLKIIELSK
ncbi:triose-phosphate isomerase [Buchnera aphidicola]|uniref:Triosephosphate isomerase n=1 Tax=Buchnera aphidicola str. USDA (Myzus persicae) TaxID=1009856 RepID=W0NZY3_BUCMP|nr:triose-phosphate isomerase [Buchnera aphidicola]AHG60076.1 Tpia [Buchnera aphidicola str. USDA (Myzus persicae)]AHG60656.1 Tpia [Buchnera aphidicola str. W106 (Myzus persicae)]AHG61228.1 Tpia [Buchnera aphidicola str. G002 (Myzus persicae)]AHG61801.1 Tpia [Buchnera aphidicola str. F009 (Myzus persicae)]WAI03237.1 MAG: triose-phosphate isomerase [Buchnera aphidicola (Myzus persicae)]